MRPETAETPHALRYGYTTGTCATATSLAAARQLLTGVSSSMVEVTLPRGQSALLSLSYCGCSADAAQAATVKDAGDDPDVTHGALIIATVRLSVADGVSFHAGDGVGMVTLPGLPLAVGEPAINPTPRRMMREHLAQLAAQVGYRGGFAVTIGVANGAALALKTMNPRLGIVGGLSILGTTGIVRPFSCSAYIASIQQAMQVAQATGCGHIAACTGAASERLLRSQYPLPEVALIEIGDFIGALLKHLRHTPFAQLSIAGGFGKISKLAAGHLNLHSQHSSVDLPLLAQEAATLGANSALQAAISSANTSQQGLALAQAAGLALGDHICARARAKALAIIPAGIAVEVWAIDRDGQAVGHAGFATCAC